MIDHQPSTSFSGVRDKKSQPAFVHGSKKTDHIWDLRCCLELWTKSKSYFLTLEMTWDLFKVSEKYRVYGCAPPRTPLKSRPNMRTHRILGDIADWTGTCERIENYAQIMGFCLATQIKIWKRVLDRTRSVYKRRGCKKSSVQWKCDFGIWTVAWHTDPLLSSTS